MNDFYNFDFPHSDEETQEEEKPKDVGRKILYGTDIFQNPTPQTEEEKLHFYDKDGKYFGMSEELLSKHLLLLGGIGCGKTTVFNHMIRQETPDSF